MELRQLVYLDAVLETGTFTGAAARCHVAQPALWAQVRALESEWGLALFERDGRRVRPTVVLLALRPHVRVLLGDASQLRGEVERMRTGEAGVVRLGAPPYQMTYFLAEAIAEHARRHPSARLPVVVPIATADPYTALHEGLVDLVAGVEPEAHGLEGVPLYDAWLAAVGARVRTRTLQVHSLRDLPLAVLTREFASRRMLEAACAQSGIVPKIVFEDSHADALLALARQGLAVAIVVNEALAIARDLPAAELHAGGKPLRVPLSLAWREEATLSPAARALRDTIASVAAARRAAPPGRAARGRQADAGPGATQSHADAGAEPARGAAAKRRRLRRRAR